MRLTASRMLMLTAGLAVAAPALAIPDVVTFTNQGSPDAPVEDTTNTNQVRNLPGGYTLGNVSWDGTASPVNGATRGSEMRVRLTRPGGVFADITLGQGNTFGANTPFSGSFSGFAGFDMPAAANWTFRFFESVEDTENANDAIWNSIAFTFNELVPATPPPNVIDLGRVTPSRSPVVGNYFPTNAERIGWFKFTIEADVTMPGFLDIDTLDSDSTNTEIALYKANGVQIVSDDNDGPGSLSQLSFGAGGGFPPMGGMLYDGRDGNLTAGTYYIAAANFDAVFGPVGFDATGGSASNFERIQVNIRTNIPAPASAGVLGAAGLLALRRRRA